MKRRGVYLYRAIDLDGNLVDVLLSERQDQAAAEAFFRSARTVTGSIPDRVTTDGHSSYPGAIRAELGETGNHSALQQDAQDGYRYPPLEISQ